VTSLYQVHKYMSLDPDDLGYFISQVGAAAQVVGLTSDEANSITTQMSTGLTYRCKPPTAITPGGPLGPQSICTNAKCPLAPGAVCSAYNFDNGTSPDPAPVNGVVTPTPTANSTAPPAATSGAPSSNNRKTVKIAVGVAVPVGVIAIALISYLIYQQRKEIGNLEDRLTQVEGNGTSHGIPSEIGSLKGQMEPQMASLNTVRNSQATIATSQGHISSYQQYSLDAQHYIQDQYIPEQDSTIGIAQSNPSPAGQYSQQPDHLYSQSVGSSTRVVPSLTAPPIPHVSTRPVQEME
jgi:hypothetical protein